MFKRLSSILFFLSFSFALQGQITIQRNGNVSVNKTLKVGNPSSSYQQLGVKCGSSCGSSFIKYGIYVTNEDGASQRYGIDSRSLGSGSNYGIRGYAEFGSVNRGIVGAASGSNSYGGYFTNGIYVSGGITQSSDERLKKNIEPLEGVSILSKVLQLKPKKFEFFTKEELKQKGLPSTYSTEGTHFGLIAQELEEVFPELVSNVVHDINQDQSEQLEINSEPTLVTTKAINYQELTVVLLAALQKQQSDLDMLKAEIEALKSQLGIER